MEVHSARVNNELIRAFDVGGYTTVNIALRAGCYFSNVDRYYVINSTAYAQSAVRPYILPPYADPWELQSRQKLVNLAQLIAPTMFGAYINGKDRLGFELLYDEAVRLPLTHTAPQTLVDALTQAGAATSSYGWSDASMVQSLYDSLYVAGPKLTVMHLFSTHPPFTLSVAGGPARYDDNVWDYRNYPPSHAYAGHLLLGMVDMILESDPNAVIVLQSDHGIHRLDCLEAFTREKGAQAAAKLGEQVFSCVRIAQEYQTGEEGVLAEPLNISRYLVNTFVGRNYEYLPAQ